MIREKIEKIKFSFLPHENDIIFVLAVILIGVIGFGLGRISVSKEKYAIKIEQNKIEQKKAQKTDDQSAAIIKAGESAQVAKKNEQFVGSKNGDVFHLPSCPGAKRIKEENKIYFTSKENAEKAGYRPAENCEGI
ncbi:hypothetical protein HYW53_03945 [Candidatus Giovannonibacteria bacterium]|nr:hypothetical protein [Candidatus Giovannonibacteria bacterium]